MKAGDYRAASLEGTDDEYLFLIVFKTVRKRRKYFLATKCDWDSKKPLLTTDEGAFAAWFNSKGTQMDPIGNAFKII